MHIKTNDTVEVIAGDDKDERGKVLSIDRRAGRLVVEGVNRVEGNARADQQRAAPLQPLRQGCANRRSPGQGRQQRAVLQEVRHQPGRDFARQEITE
jgi:ribosomal protein L24